MAQQISAETHSNLLPSFDVLELDPNNSRLTASSFRASIPSSADLQNTSEFATALFHEAVSRAATAPTSPVSQYCEVDSIFHHETYN